MSDWDPAAVVDWLQMIQEERAHIAREEAAAADANDAVTSAAQSATAAQPATGQAGTRPDKRDQICAFTHVSFPSHLRHAPISPPISPVNIGNSGILHELASGSRERREDQTSQHQGTNDKPPQHQAITADGQTPAPLAVFGPPGSVLSHAEFARLPNPKKQVFYRDLPDGGIAMATPKGPVVFSHNANGEMTVQGADAVQETEMDQMAGGGSAAGYGLAGAGLSGLTPALAKMAAHVPFRSLEPYQQQLRQQLQQKQKQAAQYLVGQDLGCQATAPQQNASQAPIAPCNTWDGTQYIDDGNHYNAPQNFGYGQQYNHLNYDAPVQNFNYTQAPPPQYNDGQAMPYHHNADQAMPGHEATFANPPSLYYVYPPIQASMASSSTNPPQYNPHPQALAQAYYPPQPVALAQPFIFGGPIYSDGNSDHRPHKKGSRPAYANEVADYENGLKPLFVAKGGDPNHICRLPQGYSLWYVPRATAKGGQDAYLYGHPDGRSRRFRSRPDFLPHYWHLVYGTECTCRHCGGKKGGGKK